MRQPDVGIVSAVGAVVIGRNEGDRLKVCLASGVREAAVVVYVDSGSTDDSVGLARSLQIETIELDPQLPFSAARARNEGFRQLLQAQPNLQYVQFVDGDCELHAGWLQSAALFLASHPEIAVVSGHLREKNAEKSVYNQLCDIEWDTPTGEAQGCGGIAMMRASAFDAVQGFRIDLIAGEEPELCVRLRTKGWKIWRLEPEMALHDAAMTRFSQWWKRSQRGGYAIAQGAALHGAPPVRYGIKETRSILLWGLAIPLLTLVLAGLTGPAGLLMLAIYPLQVARLALTGSRTQGQNWLNALFLVIGKFPGLLGMLRFHARRALGRQARLMEYSK
jgi:GT2 family glycosyltransferase